jgi:ATP-dependent Zn protease
MTHAMQHCDRPWWKRPPFWFIAIAVVALLVFAVMEQTGKGAVTPYSQLFDQIEAGNVASVSFNGTEVSGQFKHPVDTSPATGAVKVNAFRSRLPDFGDPTLIPALRKQHVVIDVASPSAWTWLLGRLPWPMLIFLGALLVAGLVRLARGGKASAGSAAPGLPGHGIIGLVSGLIAKQQPDEGSPARDRDEPKKP